MICGMHGKICYPSAGDAQRAVGAFLRRRGHHQRDKNHAYYCEHTSAYHIGHYNDGRDHIKRSVKKKPTRG